MILLDTSVVSAVLRRRKKGDAEEALARRVGDLLRSEKEIVLPGIVLQELLSGIADRAHHARVLDAARASFPVVLATEGDHLKAADLVNLTAGAGMALSTTDALIVAQALNRRASLFTTDGDFARLHALVGLRLV